MWPPVCLVLRQIKRHSGFKLGWEATKLISSPVELSCLEFLMSLNCSIKYRCMFYIRIMCNLQLIQKKICALVICIILMSMKSNFYFKWKYYNYLMFFIYLLAYLIFYIIENLLILFCFLLIKFWFS